MRGSWPRSAGWGSISSGRSWTSTASIASRGALHAEDPDLGLGVARCVRLPTEPSVAEAAVTVVDEYQGRGLGTLLFLLLADTAREAGIDTFRGYVLPDNARVRRAAERDGLLPSLEGPGLLRYEVPLDRLPPAQTALSTPGNRARRRAG